MNKLCRLPLRLCVQRPQTYLIFKLPEVSCNMMLGLRGFVVELFCISEVLVILVSLGLLCQYTNITHTLAEVVL